MGLHKFGLRLSVLVLLGMLTSCGSDPGGTQLVAGADAWSEEGYAMDSGDPMMWAPRAEVLGEDITQTDVEDWNLSGRNITLDDAARMLAGLPALRQDDPFRSLRRSRAWEEHAAVMDRLFLLYRQRHEDPIRSWLYMEAPDAARSSTLFYPFSGPDFLFAQAFFPRADTVVMCGLESAEVLPKIENLKRAEVDQGLSSLRTALDTVMQYSYFITKDMRNDLQSSRFRGVLPVLLVFVARCGHRVEGVDAIRLGSDGNAAIAAIEQGAAPGLLIRYRTPGGALRRLYYLRQNLANDGLRADSPFLVFVRQAAPGAVFLKSASYLLHENSFSVIRQYLLEGNQLLLQDPSGVPFRMLEPAGWQLRLYGNYERTLDLFGEKCQQPDLAAAYAAGLYGARPLSFGIGYLHQAERTSLMVARRR